jgi:hypothetical protein
MRIDSLTPCKLTTIAKISRATKLTACPKARVDTIGLPEKGKNSLLWGL